MSVALMWEAKAPEGRGAELLAWASEQTLERPPLRRETFRAPADRVLVVTWWGVGYDAEVPELPDAPRKVTSRPVRRWRFEPVDGN